MAAHGSSPACRLITLLWAAAAVGLPSVPAHAAGSFSIRPLVQDSSAAGFTGHRPALRPRVALVLSGGGARGVAQIGVLRSLERNGIPVDFIVATSLGAVVGGLYAAGYTPDELERMVLETDWDDVLALTGETRRTDLLMDEKLATDRSFVALRFQGFQPVIPSAVATGERLTNYLSEKTLQALYHPNPGFDDLKIPFRAVATDLVSGRRVVLARGSLAEALRATSTVPLLFSPIDRDSMELVDGGLVSNIPADVAHEAGVGIVLVVNSTSGMRTRAELDAPWKTADQIMGIMMQSSNKSQLELADVVVTPAIGGHLSSDFTLLDSLIRRGEEAADEAVPAVRRLLEAGESEMLDAAARAGAWGLAPGTRLVDPVVTVRGGEIPPWFSARVREQDEGGPLGLEEVARLVQRLYAAGIYREVHAEVDTAGGGRVTYMVQPKEMLRGVEFEGCRVVPADSLRPAADPYLGRVLSAVEEVALKEAVLRTYRARGYSLARITACLFDPSRGLLRIRLDEGIIRAVSVEGGVRTQDSFILGEFPLEEGDVFQIRKAERGLANLNGTRLFEYVYLEMAETAEGPLLTIRLKERPSQLLRLGLRADNERNLQVSLDIRDDNFRGSGGQLGLTLAGGARNREAVLEYATSGFPAASLTLGASAFYSLEDIHLYGDARDPGSSRWRRERTGEYRQRRAGGEITFGSHLERLGAATISVGLQDVRVDNLENAASLQEHLTLALVRVGTVLDSKDRYPFPSSGVGLDLSYEIASTPLGGDAGYNALKVMYESYTTWGPHTLHPRVTAGLGDRTMPLAQQFRFGGRGGFFGLNEDDRRGRQLFLLNLEYRFRLPVRLLLDSYLRFRYDVGSIALEPEELKFSSLRHGIGAELALDTPVGPALFGVGRSFLFVRDLPDNPLHWGSFLFYFHVGYQP